MYFDASKHLSLHQSVCLQPDSCAKVACLQISNASSTCPSKHPLAACHRHADRSVWAQPPTRHTRLMLCLANAQCAGGEDDKRTASAKVMDVNHMEACHKSDGSSTDTTEPASPSTVPVFTVVSL